MRQDLHGVGLSWGVVKSDVTHVLLDSLNLESPDNPRPGISVLTAQLILFLCVLLGKKGAISEPLFPHL